ncbi:ABC transporter permease [Fuscibacter oryzae]|uniref:ABC transporter permease n=1 Tax=Fuscibacter oryzae TaxID=2803939 RepID=A0A8J7MX63_9RHOB|nr:ABC transporter permease [Fuscibacter oryzae]MBL4929434.1 ABC transporter permease [Fuscibacter oryzae]
MRWSFPSFDRRQRSGLALAAPTAVFLVIFFVVPAAVLLVYSFWISRSFQITPTLTLSNYLRALGNAGMWLSMWNGVWIGAWTAVFSVALSFPVAWYIAYRTRSNAILYAVLLSWFSSYLVRIYAWRTILGTSGLINSTLMQLGMIDQPLSFLIFSRTAVIVTLVHLFVPFTLLLLLSALRNVRTDYLEAARDLGASWRQSFLRVVVPMAYKGIVGSFMFTFILAAGDFISPQLLGGREGVTTGLLISNQFRQTGNWSFGAALAFILLGVFLFAYFLVAQSMRLGRLSPGLRFHPTLPTQEKA